MTAHFACDASYRISWSDDAFARFVGESASTLVGRPAIELIAACDRPAVMQAAACVGLGGDAPVVITCTWKGSDAGPVTLVMTQLPAAVGSVACAVVTDDAERAVGAGRITQAELLARREELAASREELLARREATLAEREQYLAREEVAAATRDAAASTQRIAITAQVTALAAQRDLLAAAAGGRNGAAARPQRPQHGHLPMRLAEMRYRGNRYGHPPAAHPPDSLTGLATRATLMDELDRAGASTESAVLLVDLDDFKSINDTHGHEVGDEVLVSVAEALRRSVRPEDVVVRFGGDEFVVLCANRAAAVTVADRIVTQLGSPAATSVGPVTVTASVGISDATIPTRMASDLLARADAAMYWAKQLGKNRFFIYDETLHARLAQDRHTESLLRDALDDGRILLRYQPIVDVSDEVVGVETMARLVDREGVVKLPAEFLSVAERTGLIGAIDTWTLGESCRAVAEIRRLTGRQLTVSVNVSAALLDQEDFVARVSAALERTGLPADALMLEFAESTLLVADAAAIGRLGRLRASGVAIAVDDFGAGVTPLTFLRRLPLSHVKVSRPCISSMLDDDRDAAMVEALIWLVDQLGLTWVAEGVETQAQWQAIRQLGPGYGQGYLFAQPLPEPDLIRALTADMIGRQPGGVVADVTPHGASSAWQRPVSS